MSSNRNPSYSTAFVRQTTRNGETLGSYLYSSKPETPIAAKARACSPTPLNETASITFSKVMLYESMIKPAIAAKGFKPERTDYGYSLAVNVDVDKGIHQDKVTDGPSSDCTTFHSPFQELSHNRFSLSSRTIITFLPKHQ